jgi:hypothetical protein
MYLEQILIAISVCIQARIPVLIWGSPGTGKTSAITSIAKSLNLVLEVVIASIKEPSDFSGLPFIDPITKSTCFAAPDWAKRLCDAGQGILFFDELTTAAPAVQKALLRVVLEKVVGGLTLPNSISIIAAANPPEEASDGYDLTPPLANRWIHVIWPNDAQAWCHGMKHGWQKTSLPTLNANWESHIKPVTTLVTGFIDKMPEMLYQFPTDTSSMGKAWPSNRSWDMAIKVMAACQSAQICDEIMFTLVAGCIGEGAAAAFSSYLRELNLPDPETLLADPDSLVLTANRHDVIQATLMSVVTAVLRNMTVERYRQGLRVLCKAATQGAFDIAWPAFSALDKHKPADANSAIPEMAIFKPFIELVA